MLLLVFQLRPTSAMGFWWPCRLLEGGQSKGDVYCSPEALLVRFAPGEGGMLACSKDSTRFPVHTNPSSGSRNSNSNSQWTLMSVPWEQVRCVVELTASVLLVTVAFDQVTTPPLTPPPPTLIRAPNPHLLEYRTRPLMIPV